MLLTVYAKVRKSIAIDTACPACEHPVIIKTKTCCLKKQEEYQHVFIMIIFCSLHFTERNVEILGGKKS